MSLDVSLQDYLKEKYPEEFANLQKQREQASTQFDTNNPESSPVGSLITGLRAAMKGNTSYDEMKKAAFEQRQRERAAALAPFSDKEKALEGKFKAGKEASDYAFESGQRERTTASQAEEDDSGSPTSKQYQSLLAKMLGKSPEEFQGLSATKIKSMIPATEKMYEAELRRQELSLRRSELSDQRKDRLNRQGDEDVRRYQESYNKSKIRENAATQVDRVDNAIGQLGLALKGNQAARNSVEAMVSQAAMPQNKRFNEHLANKFGGASWARQIEDKWTRALKGGIDSQDAKDLVQLLTMYRSAAQDTIRDEGIAHAKQLSQLNKSPMEENYTRITGDDWNPPTEKARSNPPVARATPDGGVALFDPDTRQFLGWQKEPARKESPEKRGRLDSM